MSSIRFPAYLFFTTAILLSGACSDIVDPKIYLGNSGCQSSSQCEGQADLVECKEGICGCKEGYTSAYNRSTCLPIRNLLGDPCEETSQCDKGSLGSQSFCNDTVCTCQLHDSASGKCYEKLYGIYQMCEVDFQCQALLGPLSKCANETSPIHTCNCKEGTILNNQWNKCLPKSRIGEACEDWNQCPGNVWGGSKTCSASGRCSCGSSYVPGSGLDMCLPIVYKLGNDCEEGHQCQLGTPGVFSDCIKSASGSGRKVCNCSENAVSEPGHDECFEVAGEVGAPCEVHSQCLVKLGPSLCIGGACKCLGNATGTASKNQRCQYADSKTPRLLFV